MSTIKCAIFSEVSGSRPVVGSSYRMISGSSAIERASATRFFIPPESSEGIFRCVPARPTIESFSATVSGSPRESSCVLRERERDVLLHVHRVEERPALEEHREPAPDRGELLLGKRHHGLAEHPHVSRVGLRQPVDVSQRDALARPRGPQDADHLAAEDLQVDAGQDLLRAVSLPDVLELDDDLSPRGGARGFILPGSRRGCGLETHSARNSFVRKKSEMSTQIEAKTTVLGRRDADRRRAALRAQPVPASDESDLETEEERLPEAAHDVGDLELAPDARQVVLCRHPELDDRDQQTAEDAEHVGEAGRAPAS